MIIFNPIPLTGQAAQVMEEFGFEPYTFFSTAPEVFWQQAASTFIITVLIGIYPIISTLKIKEIKALHA